jgi:anti-sigma regulatory factor (Ser/Thr protein kinase)
MKGDAAEAGAAVDAEAGSRKEKQAGTARLAVPADLAYLALVGEFVLFMARRAGFAETDAARLRLAVDEACANAIEHGGLSRAGQPLEVVCEASVDALTVRVADCGSAFTIAEAADPEVDAPLEKRRIGGLGLYLMRRVMDHVEFRPNAGGKELVLTKRVRPEKAVSDEA